MVDRRAHCHLMAQYEIVEILTEVLNTVTYSLDTVMQFCLKLLPVRELVTV